MPIDITSFLMLEDKKSNGWGGGRNITHIISLHEGHDRAYWQWVKHPKLSQFKPSSVWIPEAPETALRDGLLMLIADGLEDISLQALITYESGSFGRVDLTRSNSFNEDVESNIVSSLQNYEIRLLAFSDSTILGQGIHDFPIEPTRLL